MFVRKNFPIGTLYTDVYIKPKYGEKDTSPIDQSPVLDFNINPDTGRLMSDMTKLLHAQSQFEHDKLLKELTFRKVDLTEMTDAQINDTIKYARPYLSQLPSEMADHAEYLQQERFRLREEKRKAALDNVTRELEDVALEEYAKRKKFKGDKS